MDISGKIKALFSSKNPHSTNLALRTWYKGDDPLRLDFEPAVLGLAGEAGEILDQYKKFLFKKNATIGINDFLDELGDLWYYLRIRAWQIGHGKFEKVRLVKLGTLDILVELNFACAGVASFHINSDQTRRSDNVVFRLGEHTVLDYIYTLLVMRLDELEISIDYLTELNYSKLSGGKHGWEENNG